MKIHPFKTRLPTQDPNSAIFSSLNADSGRSVIGASPQSAIRNPQSAIAFTLVELLVSTAIISLIMLLLVQVTNNISMAWRTTAEKVEKFQEARDGFEAMTRRISQATLNTYWDYYDISGITRNMSNAPQNFIPFTYGRQSDLRFVSGPMSGPAWSITAGTGTMTQAALNYMPTHGIFFPAPLGKVRDDEVAIYGAMNNLLNTWGYFIEVGADNDAKIGSRPAFLSGSAGVPPARWRSRLMEFREPAEGMLAYQDPTATAGKPNARDWFLKSLSIADATRPTRVMSENVIALIIYPRLSKVDEVKRKANNWSMLCPNYTFDSSLLPKTALQTVPVTGAPPSLSAAPLNPGATVTSNTDASDASGIDPRNQLPPVITVTIVALDDRSAQRLNDITNPGTAQTTGTFDPTFKALYGPSTAPLFSNAIVSGTDNLGDADTVGTDMYTFTQSLIKMHLTYRIFSTNVTIRGAKWSRGQTN